MALRRIRLHIGGTDFTVSTDETESYVRELAADIDHTVNGILETDSRISGMVAAFLTALDYADAAKKAEAAADNLREQVKGYLDDNAAVRQELDNLRKEYERQKREVELLRGLKAGGNSADILRDVKR